MQNLLYDFYGIYIEKIEDGKFVYRNDCFLFCPYQGDENSFCQMIFLYEFILSKTNLSYLKAVKNKYHQYVSSNMVLFVYRLETIKIEEVMKISLITVDKTDIKSFRQDWIQELDFIENQALTTIMGLSKQFDYLYALTIYYLGLGECALSYLLDYCNQITYLPVGFILKCEKLEDYIDWLHPFNYQLTLRVSLISDLYRLSYITIDQLEKCLGYFSREEIMMLFIYSIYPKDFFNHLKLFVNQTIEETYFLNLYSLIEIEEKRIKDLYQRISKYVNLRPIEWL